MNTLIIGIGNILLSDDGIGVYVADHIQRHYSELPDTRCIDGGTLSFTLLDQIEDADNLIVIDATQLNDSPGSIRILVGPVMDHFLNHQKQKSVHDIVLIDLLAMTNLIGRQPNNRALIGIQPYKTDWGDSPTPSVKTAIPLASQSAVNLIQEWRQ